MLDSQYLKSHYAQLSDEELARLRSTDLVPEARRLLEAELASRVNASSSVESDQYTEPRGRTLYGKIVTAILLGILGGGIVSIAFVTLLAALLVGRISWPVGDRLLFLLIFPYELFGADDHIKGLFFSWVFWAAVFFVFAFAWLCLNPSEAQTRSQDGKPEA